MTNVHDWRVELIETYADLFHPAGHPPRAEGWPYVDDGWRDLLERACVRIRAAVQADGGTFRICQIKEKYGSARIYWTGTLSPEASAKVEDAIDLAEARSAVTCEICGEPGLLHGPGWFTTRCAQHAEGRRLIGGQPRDDIHVMERVVGDRRQTLRRRYDRETDTFVDVDPFTADREEH